MTSRIDVLWNRALKDMPTGDICFVPGCPYTPDAFIMVVGRKICMCIKHEKELNDKLKSLGQPALTEKVD